MGRKYPEMFKFQINLAKTISFTFHFEYFHIMNF